MSELNPETSLIRSGRSDQPDSLAPVLFPSTTHVVETLEEGQRKSRDLSERRFYSRHSNPSVGAFEEAMAELEGAESARAFASGMGAISSVVFGLCEAGDHIVAQRQLYGATFLFLQWVKSRLGIEVTFVDAAEPGSFAAAVRPQQTKLVFAETPSNPRLDIVDLRALGEIAGPVVVADSTAAPPVLQRPLEHGVDLSLHSATKYIAGHNDALLGVISGSEELLEWLRGYAVLHGASASPFDAMNGLRGLRTLGVRVARQCETAQMLAEMLEAHEGIERVWHPGLASHPNYELASKQMEKPGGLLAFDLAAATDGNTAGDAKGDTESNTVGNTAGNTAGEAKERKDAAIARGAAFVDALQIAQNATSFGGPETLATHPASTTHAGLLPEELEAAGIKETTIRVSVGLEHPDDLLADFSNALQQAAAG